MTTTETDGTTVHPTVSWPVWQRVLFRFFFIYWILTIAPWTWLFRVPVLRKVPRYMSIATDRAVQFSNKYLFHVRDTLVYPNGSGDTSWGWTRVWLFLSIATAGCLLWSLLDRRKSYPRLGYWLRTFVRYYIATFALSYGIIKLFLLQMPFPNLSLLSTPLGDLLPMRLSWLFIGYSDKYQFFSGLAETVAGVLLLWRPTVTLGLFAATGAFVNVVMINMAYDVPVKIFASHLLLACLFLLAWDAKRLITLLVLNRPVSGTGAYEPYFTGVWRWAARAVKWAMVWLILVLPFRNSFTRYRLSKMPPPASAFPAGIYEVTKWAPGGDTAATALAVAPDDSLRWRDVIFDSYNAGSVGSQDTVFWQRYRRGYFRYKTNPEDQTAVVWRTSFALDSTYIFTARYEMPDTNTIRLWTKLHGDSLYVELARKPRHFQLTERQFHWLSEWNR